MKISKNVGCYHNFFFWVLYGVFLYIHILGELKKMDISKTPKNAKCFYCEKCHFKCSKLSEWNRHILTTKHKLEIMDINRKSIKMPELFKCECGKLYKNNSGLWKHKKKCTYLEEEEKEEQEKEEHVIENKEEGLDYKELLIKAMTQMSEQQTQAMTQISKQQTQLAEQQKQIAEIMPLIGNNNTTNSNNNTTNNFNLNFFLNETCKDALNITDFINSLQIQLKDLEYTAENGHIKGITNIFQRALSNMEVTKRPMHCTDLKRETLYIKDNNEWNRDDEKDKIKDTILQIKHKNATNVVEWTDKYPEHENIDSNEFDMYMKMTSNCMSAVDDSDNNKIVKNILKEVMIDKNI